MLIKIITTYSFVFYLLCIAFGFFVSLLLYYRDKKLSEIGKTLKVILFLLRFSTTAFLSFLLLSPIINKPGKSFDKPAVLVAIDNSESIVNHIDTQQIYQQLIPELNSLEESLSDNLKFKYYLFGEKLKDYTKPDFTDKSTNISQALNELNNLYTYRNLGAFILLSDGNANTGTNPTYIAENMNAPVYTVLLGDSVAEKDLIIRSIENNDNTFSGDYFPVIIELQALNLPNTTSSIQISLNNRIVFEKQIEFSTENEILEEKILLRDTVAGLKKYAVFLKNVDNEKNITNNSRNFYIEVIQSKKKIQILSFAPHPDVAAIKEALLANRKFDVSVIDPSKKIPDPDSLDLVIFHQLPNKEYNLEVYLQKLKKLNIPILFIAGGKTSFKLLNNFQANYRYSPMSANTDEMYPLVNNTFNLFEINKELEELLDNVPPLLGFAGENSYQNESDILCFQKIKTVETKIPLIMFSDIQNYKLGYIFGEGLWRWRIYDYKLAGSNVIFNELINKIIQYLTLQKRKNRFVVDIDKVYSEKKQIIITAELYNKSYEKIHDNDIEFMLTDELGKQFPYQFTSKLEEYEINLGRLNPGKYQYKAKTEYKGEIFEDRGNFLVQKLNIENLDVLPDVHLLKQIAFKTKAKMFTTSELNLLKDELLRIKPKNKDNYTVNYFELIDIKWIFFLVLIFLGVEWFIRKYHGSI